MTLSEWMAAKALNDEQVAPMLGISRVHTSRVRRGISDPSLALLKKIVKVTRGEVTANDIVRPREAIR